MELTETARVRLLIDGKEAVSELTKLEQTYAELIAKQGEFKKNSKEWADLQKEIKETAATISIVRERAEVASMSFSELNRYQKDLVKSMKDMKQGSDEYVSASGRLKEVNTRIDSIRADFRATDAEVNKSKTTWESLKGWIVGAFSFAAIFEFGRQLFAFISDSVAEFKKFETAAQSLKGETQMTGETLEYFKQQAVESGEAFGKTGEEMLQAYNAIASGKSDLLENREALKAVTDEAIRLSLVGEIDVPDAAKVMVESLNQFGAGADEAAKYVDILATGTIVGAGKIQEIGAALKYVGPVAKAAGLSFGETNSALQILHQNGIKGEQAGTALRGTLAQLMKGADDTNPSIVGLDVAVDNLSKKHLSAKDAIKLFGTENVSAGLALVNNAKTMKEWTTKIEEGGGAATMLADKTKTLEFQTKQTEAAIKNQMVAIGQGLAPVWVDLLGLFRDVGMPVIQGIITGFITVINVLRELPRFIVDNKELFIALGVALVSLNVEMIAATASTIAYNAVSRGQAIATAAAATAQAALNAVMSANPISLVVSAVALLIGGFITLYNKFETVRAISAALWESFKGLTLLIYDVAKAVLSLDFSGLWNKIKNGFGQVAKDSMQAYNDEMAKGHTVTETNAKNSIDKKVADEKKGHDDVKNSSIGSNAAANSKKAEDNKKHRDEQLAANKEMLDKIDDAWAKSLKDELASKKAQLLQKYEADVDNIAESKASESVKATWTKILNQNLINDLTDLENKYTKLKIDNLEKIEAREFQASDFSEKMQERLHNRVLNWENEKQAANQRRIQQEIIDETDKTTAIAALIQGDLNGFVAAMGKKLDSVTAFKLNAASQYLQFYDAVSGYVNDMVAKFADAARAMIDIAKMRIQVELNLIEKGKQDETKAVKDELKKQEDAIIDLDAKIAKLEEEKYFEKDEKRRADLQAEIDKLNKEKEAITVQKNATTAELTRIEKDYDNNVRQQKLDAWNKQKELEVKMALINATQAYVKALSSGFPPFNYATAVLVMKAAKEQVEVIRSEPAPEFEKGTFQPMRDDSYFQNAGVLGGLRHSSPEGGNWVINPRNGKLLAKVEEGEYMGVFARDVTKRYGGLLSKLANSSLARSGKPVYAESGFYGDINEGVPADVADASNLATNAGVDLEYINKNTEGTMKAIMDSNGILTVISEHLSDISRSTARTAEKEFSINIRNVIDAADVIAEIDRRSSFG